MTGAQAAGLPTREADSAAASAVKAMQAEGRHAEARERYAELVARHQRRAARIAFHYLRDSARSGRGGPGCVREGVFAPVGVPRRTAVRGLVHAHPDQRMPGSDQGADAPRAVAGADARVAASGSGTSRSASPAADRRPEDQVLGARAAAAAGGGAVAAARTAALGFHVEPLRGLHVARGQRHDWTERVDGPRAPVPRDPDDCVRCSPRMARASGWAGEKRRVTS